MFIGLGLNYFMQSSYVVFGSSNLGFEFDFANNVYILGN